MTSSYILSLHPLPFLHLIIFQVINTFHHASIPATLAWLDTYHARIFIDVHPQRNWNSLVAPEPIIKISLHNLSNTTETSSNLGLKWLALHCLHLKCLLALYNMVSLDSRSRWQTCFSCRTKGTGNEIMFICQEALLYQDGRSYMDTVTQKRFQIVFANQMSSTI